MRKLIILLAIMAFAEFGMAQTYTEGSGISGIDKLGAHQNGGRGCVGCHAPHSGAAGNGGNAGTGTTADPEAGNLALWGQDLGPLYGQTLTFAGDVQITLPSLGAQGLGGLTAEEEEELLGVMTCLSCHDGNLAKGAMMTNKSYEQAMGLLPPGVYGTKDIPTLLGNDGTAGGNYKNDHPIGPDANLGAVGVASRLEWVVGGCGSTATPTDCILPLTANNTDFLAFYNHYGAFNITGRGRTNYYSGGRANVVTVGTNPALAYLVCTTCHTPHTMYTYSGSVKNQSTSGVYPSYFFVSAPYNPGALTNPTTASSATQFCRQCHFTGAGGSNEGSKIYGVTTRF